MNNYGISLFVYEVKWINPWIQDHDSHVSKQPEEEVTNGNGWMDSMHSWVRVRY